MRSIPCFKMLCFKRDSMHLNTDYSVQQLCLAHRNKLCTSIASFSSWGSQPVAGYRPCVIWEVEGWQVAIYRGKLRFCCLCKILHALLDHGTEFIGNGADDRKQLSDSSIALLIMSTTFMLCTCFAHLFVS